MACDSVTIMSHWILTPVPRVETKRKEEENKKKIKRNLGPNFVNLTIGSYTEEFSPRSKVVWWWPNKVWRLVKRNPIISQEQQSYSKR